MNFRLLISTCACALSGYAGAYGQEPDAAPLEVAGSAPALRYVDAWLEARAADETAADAEADDDEGSDNPADADEPSDEEDAASEASDDADDETDAADAEAETGAAEADAEPPIATTRVTGAAGAFYLLCGGGGGPAPDLIVIDREINDGERALCEAAGVEDLVALVIGHDALIVARGRRGPRLDLTVGALHRALAARLAREADGEVSECAITDNTNTRWTDVESGMPRVSIGFAAPPEGDASRAALIERVIEPAARATAACVNALRYADRARYGELALSLRADERVILTSADPAARTAAVNETRGAVTVLNAAEFAALEEELRDVRIEGVSPDGDAIASGAYPLARPVYLYARLSALEDASPLSEAVREFVCDAAASDGALAQAGLTPPDGRDLAQRCEAAALLEPIAQ